MAQSLTEEWKPPLPIGPELHDGEGDVAMADADAPPPSKPSTTPEPSTATSTLAKFKAAQDLKIQTKNLPTASCSRAATISAVSATSSTSGSAPAPKPPASTGKKRRRRTAAQIDRKYSCNYPGCNKAYGSEGSLTQHQRLKHRESGNKSLAFLAPLRAAGAGPTAGGAVNIRPATAFNSDVAAALDPTNPRLTVAMDLAASSGPPASKTSRGTLRSRSNSMPVTFSPPQASAVVISTTPAPASAPGNASTRVPPARKPRRSGTPHPKTGSTRRAKRRSKSESLTEVAPVPPLLALDELAPPRSDRSASDSTASIHEHILPVASSGSFEWPPCSVAASASLPAPQLHASTSWSSDEHAIDSDILSVLATCDSADVADASSLAFGHGDTGGPPSTSSYRSNPSFGDSEDAEMLPVGMECFQITEDSLTMVGAGHDVIDAHLGGPELYDHLAASDNQLEHDVGLQAFGSLDDDWTGATHLSSHLERMSVAHRSDTPLQDMGDVLDRLAKSKRTSVDVGAFAAVSTELDAAMGATTPLDDDAFAPSYTSPELDNQLADDDDLSGGSSHCFGGFGPGGGPPTEPQDASVAMKPESDTQQLLWPRSLPCDAGVSTTMGLEPSNQLDAVLDSVPQQRDGAMEWSSARFGPSAAFYSELRDVETGAGFGLGDPGLASALLCSREEL